MGVPGPHAGPRIHPTRRGRRLRGRVSDQLEIERLSRSSRAHLRSAVRTGLPPRARRAGAGRDLSPQAGRRGPQRRRCRAVAQAAREAQRQARRLRRRGAGVSDRRARSGGARLRGGRVRRRCAGRRHDAQPNPEIPPSRRGDRRGSRLRPGRRRVVRRGKANREPEGVAGRRLRRHLRRLRRAAGPRSLHPRARGGGGEHSHRHRLAGRRIVRPYPRHRAARHRARRRQHRHGLLPHLASARRRRRQGGRAVRISRK